jgi:transposase
MAPEHVSGELLPPAPGAASFPIPAPTRKTRELTTQQYQAAVAEAHGMQRKEIAKLIGVSEPTIKNWRGIEEYQTEVQRLRDIQTEMVTEAVVAMKEELTEGVRAAIRALTDNLEATDSKGHPVYGIRRDSAELLLKYGIELHKEAQRRNSDAAAGQPAQATQVVINMGDGPPDTTTVTQ